MKTKDSVVLTLRRVAKLSFKETDWERGVLLRAATDYQRLLNENTGLRTILRQRDKMLISLYDKKYSLKKR